MTGHLQPAVLVTPPMLLTVAVLASKPWWLTQVSCLSKLASRVYP